MNGFIEIYTDGWLRYRWLFTLRDYETFLFEQQVELREADLKKIIEHLRENVVPVFDPTRTEFFIAYESKMNNDGNRKMSDGETNDLHNEKLREGDCQRNGAFVNSGAV